VRSFTPRCTRAKTGGTPAALRSRSGLVISVLATCEPPSRCGRPQPWALSAIHRSRGNVIELTQHGWGDDAGGLGLASRWKGTRRAEVALFLCRTRPGCDVVRVACQQNPPAPDPGRWAAAATAQATGDDVDTRKITLTLGPQLRTVGQARRAVERLIGGDAPVVFIRDAVLLTSEVVSNALHHTAGGCEFAATFDGSASPWLRVDVRDISRAVPVAAAKEPGVDGGWGLRLIEQIAAQWGVSPAPAGKTVWFELGGQQL